MNQPKDFVEAVREASRGGVRDFLRGRSRKFYVAAALLAAAAALSLVLTFTDFAQSVSFRIGQALGERETQQHIDKAEQAESEADAVGEQRRDKAAEYRGRAPLRQRADADAESALWELRAERQRFENEKKNFRPSTGTLRDRAARAIADARAALADDDAAGGGEPRR